MDNELEPQRDGRGLNSTIIQALEQATNVDEGMHNLLVTDPEMFYLHGYHIRKMLEYRISGSVNASTCATSAKSVANLQPQSGIVHASASATSAESVAHLRERDDDWPDLLRDRERDDNWPDLRQPTNGWR